MPRKGYETTFMEKKNQFKKFTSKVVGLHTSKHLYVRHLRARLFQRDTYSKKAVLLLCICVCIVHAPFNSFKYSCGVWFPTTYETTKEA